MGPFIAGIILLLILVVLVFIFSARFFNLIGKYGKKAIKPFLKEAKKQNKH